MGKVMLNLKPPAMKKLLLLCTICLSVFPAVRAQDWNLVVSGRLYNYSLDSVITTTIRVDSAYAEQGDSVFVLNRVSTVCSNCENKYYSNVVYLNNQPAFLLGEVVRKSNRDFHLRDTASYVIRSSAALNETWLFDTLYQRTATLKTVGSQVVFPGTEDSVKLITVADSDTILLSKHYGVLKFPDFRGHHYRLMGVEGPNPAGKRNLYFADFFTMETGDVFQYHQKSSGRFPGPVVTQKHRITGVEKNEDHILIQTSMLSITIYHDYYTPLDPVYKASNSSIEYKKSDLGYLNAYNLENITDSNPVTVAWDSAYHCIVKSYGSNGMVFQHDTVFSSMDPHIQDAIADYRYGAGIGLIRQQTSSNRYGPYPYVDTKYLTGYIHQGKTVGIIYDDAYFKAPIPPPDTTDTVTCSAYPTFFEDAIHLYCADCEGKTVIRIMDLAGTLRYEKEVVDLERTTLYPERLERGVYILEIRKKNAAAVRSKVVKK